MPIRREMRWFYPIDWAIISQEVRFGRAKGLCERCGRPHGETIKQLADGRWWDARLAGWRDDRGDLADWPDIEDYSLVSERTYYLSAAHIDHDPMVSTPDNLLALCQRCHLAHDRKANVETRRQRIRAKKALGDLLDGYYEVWLQSIPISQNAESLMVETSNIRKMPDNKRGSVS